ncbi:TetR/AcrR family transcriptional regulator [Roseibium sp.]|uniref:TetR/AcrR family transcriptional regulator n=1 Tax=Roseibium sp. TaxID=1936156 RepID=UPI003BA866C2
MKKTEGERKTSWKQDPEGVKADILAVATSVFAEAGFSGARIDEIIRRTKTSKRMIYYYFGDKSGLYSKVLEAAYTRLRKGEGQLDLEALPPLDALAKLAAFTFDFHRENPEYIRLIAIENIHHGKHLKQSETIPKLNSQIITGLEDLCRRGVEEGAFRDDVDPLELHWTISAFCVFNISNRATFSHLYGDDLFTDAGQEQLRARLVTMVLDTVRVR